MPHLSILRDLKCNYDRARDSRYVSVRHNRLHSSRNQGLGHLWGDKDVHVVLNQLLQELFRSHLIHLLFGFVLTQGNGRCEGEKQ
jgi:hypothetical protein